MVGEKGMIRAGDIGFGGKRKGIYPRLVRFFTSSRWSHCFVVTPPILGHLSVIEADLKVQCVPFQKEYVEKNTDYYEILRPFRATESQIWRACSELYARDAGATYGFLQIPWFALRALLAPLGVHLRANPLPDGEICSETIWQYLNLLGGPYARVLDGFGENECSPEDIYRAVKDRPDLFEVVLKRD